MTGVAYRHQSRSDPKTVKKCEAAASRGLTANFAAQVWVSAHQNSVVRLVLVPNPLFKGLSLNAEAIFRLAKTQPMLQRNAMQLNFTEKYLPKPYQEMKLFVLEAKKKTVFFFFFVPILRFLVLVSFGPGLSSCVLDYNSQACVDNQWFKLKHSVTG